MWPIRDNDAMVLGRQSDARPRALIAFWSGVALVLAGLSTFAYVGWQLWVTTWVAQREQRETTSSVERQWDQAGERRNLQPEHTPTGEVSALVRIPRFGSTYVVPVLEGTGARVLTRVAEPSRPSNRVSV